MSQTDVFAPAAAVTSLTVRYVLWGLGLAERIKLGEASKEPETKKVATSTFKMSYFLQRPR